MIPANTLTEILNEIRLSYPINRVTYVIVEGESDILIFRKFFHPELCKVWWCAGGYTQLEKALTEMVKDYPLVFGIRDADFIHLTGKTPETTNLFLTDHHDMEMTMVNSDATFASVANEYVAAPPANHLSIRGKLLNGLKAISCLKWINETNGLELNFGLSFGNYYKHATVSIDHNKYLPQLLHASKNHKVADLEELMAAIEALIADAHDPLQLCNGHDFMKIFCSYVLEQDKKHLSHDNLHAAFRMVYTFEEFKKNRLYAETVRWAEENNVTIYKAL